MSTPPIRLVPRNPAVPLPTLTMPELCSSLAKIWDRWHPIAPPLGDRPWLRRDDPDLHARDVAWLEIEKIWDELAALGLVTGEVVSFAMFPSPVRGYWVCRLRPVE